MDEFSVGAITVMGSDRIPSSDCQKSNTVYYVMAYEGYIYSQVEFLVCALIT